MKGAAVILAAAPAALLMSQAPSALAQVTLAAARTAAQSYRVTSTASVVAAPGGPAPVQGTVSGKFDPARCPGRAGPARGTRSPPPRTSGSAPHVVQRISGTVDVDQQGRVRRLDTRMSATSRDQQSASPEMVRQVTMTFGDFGIPVPSVSAPPGSETFALAGGTASSSARPGSRRRPRQADPIADRFPAGTYPGFTRTQAECAGILLPAAAVALAARAGLARPGRRAAALRIVIRRGLIVTS
ncbi:MAG TPA: hypothetical protein VHY31_16410 [Streptosporangiaceae bacterium]|nr:hypothetical protein [Streptosporangiaceae bacterium]